MSLAKKKWYLSHKGLIIDNISLCTMYDTSIFKYARESTICPGKEGGWGGS